MNNGKGKMQSDELIPTLGETAGRELNPFAVHFLRMAIGLWARDFPDATIQGIGKADALALTTEITGKKYGPKDFSEALADLDACRDRLRAARQRIGG